MATRQHAGCKNVVSSKVIITGSVDGGLRHYDLRKGQLVTDLHFISVLQLKACHGSKRLAGCFRGAIFPLAVVWQGSLAQPASWLTCPFYEAQNGEVNRYP